MRKIKIGRVRCLLLAIFGYFGEANGTDVIPIIIVSDDMSCSQKHPPVHVFHADISSKIEKVKRIEEYLEECKKHHPEELSSKIGSIINDQQWKELLSFCEVGGDDEMIFDALSEMKKKLKQMRSKDSNHMCNNKK